jgi:hypothetical protein
VRNVWFSFRMPLLHSEHVRFLFSSIRPSGVPCTTVTLVLRFSGLRYPMAGCWSHFTILVPDVLPGLLTPLRWHLLPGPLWTCPLRIAGTARRVKRPRAGPPLTWAHFFRRLWRLMARRWSPQRKHLLRFLYCCMGCPLLRVYPSVA